MKHVLSGVMAVAAMSFSAAGWAEDNAPVASQPGGFMLGASLGFDSGNFADELEDELAFFGNGFSVDEDDSDVGTDLYLGFVFGGASSFRLGYRQFGDQSGDVLFSGIKTSEYTLEADGLYLAVDLMLPLNETFFVGGTLGLQDWESEFSVRSAVSSASDSLDGRDFFYGLRGKALINDGKAAIVAGYSLYSFEDEYGDELEYDSFSIGLEGYFR